MYLFAVVNHGCVCWCVINVYAPKPGPTLFFLPCLVVALQRAFSLHVSAFCPRLHLSWGSSYWLMLPPQPSYPLGDNVTQLCYAMTVSHSLHLHPKFVCGGVEGSVEDGTVRAVGNIYFVFPMQLCLRCLHRYKACEFPHS